MEGWQAIATFALAAVPGILVLEILQFQRARLYERGGLRTIALYLIVSAAVWAVAVLMLGADHHLAAVIDSADRGGTAQVTAYTALAWRVAVIAIGLGLVLRVLLARGELIAFDLERRRAGGEDSAGGVAGTALIEIVSVASAWDALMMRMRRRGRTQLVHVRLRDGVEIYGMLTATGGGGFRSGDRGILLNVEFVAQGDNLVEVPGSDGIFILPESVATVAFIDAAPAGNGARVKT
jgi:hypothetical protein